MFLEVETDEKMLKAMAIDGAFWRYKKIFFWSCNTWEHINVKGDVWCILTLLETMFFKLELMRKF